MMKIVGCTNITPFPKSTSQVCFIVFFFVFTNHNLNFLILLYFFFVFINYNLNFLILLYFLVRILDVCNNNLADKETISTLYQNNLLNIITPPKICFLYQK